MNNLKILWVVIVLLLISNIFFVWQSLSYKSSNIILQSKISEQQTNNKIMFFTKTFITKVLNSTGEVSFEDRLQLENLSKEINDAEISSAWKAFTESKTSTDVEKNFYNLLQILLNKITI